MMMLKFILSSTWPKTWLTSVRYNEEFAPELQKQHRERYEGKFVTFRTVMELIDRQQNQGIEKSIVPKRKPERYRPARRLQESSATAR
jgi:hypothetical protein